MSCPNGRTNARVDRERLGRLPGGGRRPAGEGGERVGAASSATGDPRRTATTPVKMMQPEEILDKALTMMQRTSTRLMDVCKDKIQPGKSMSANELKELREVLEIIAEGLEQDSLLCQESLDEFKKGEEVYPDTPSDVTIPPYSPERHPDDWLSVAEHIEKLWGVDYDSDHMPNMSD